jgi:cellulose synthase/poly-beta-1,6-N-acetylglucosamine synthase-like glycosyltransferase
LSTLLSIATVIAFLATIGAFARLGRFRLRFPTLREWNGPGPLAWPRVSVIVPCRNEERGVERAMRTLLGQDYPDLEIVAINDRSEDRTGAILDALAREDPRLRVAHVTSLPEGWLGKNHAMREGASRAGG